LKYVMAASALFGGTMLASENQTFWAAYQPEITAKHAVLRAPVLGASVATSTEIAVDHRAEQFANMAKLAEEIAGKSRGVDAEIGAAVEENFFDWL